MTAVQVAYRRDTATNIAAATGVDGEIVVNTTSHRLVVFDGSTMGGVPAATLAEVLTNYRTAVADASYTIVPLTDRLVPFTSLTAARTITLCAASDYPQGTPLTIVDETGNCSAAKAIGIARAGSDTIDGGTTAAIVAAYGYVTLESDGVSKWTIIGRSFTPRLILPAVNANSVADNSIAVQLPPGYTRYRVNRVTLLHASTALSIAHAALYTAASAGGVAIALPQGLSSLTSTAADTAGNAIDLTLDPPAATFFTATPLYFRITVVQGSAATVDVVIDIEPYD